VEDEAHSNDFDCGLKCKDECEEKAALFQKPIPIILGFSICVVKASQED